MSVKDLKMKKLKTVAVALLDKNRIVAVRLYVVENTPPSTISFIMKKPKVIVRSRLGRDVKMLDLNMIRNDKTYQKLIELSNVYDYDSKRCKLCRRKTNYTHMILHLMKGHKEHIEKTLKEIETS